MKEAVQAVGNSRKKAEARLEGKEPNLPNHFSAAVSRSSSVRHPETDEQAAMEDQPSITLAAVGLSKTLQQTVSIRRESILLRYGVGQRGVGDLNDSPLRGLFPLILLVQAEFVDVPRRA